MTNQGFAVTIGVEPESGAAGSATAQSVLPRLCERLAAHKARATFFVTAGMLEECGSALKRALAGQAHEVASHGMSYRRMDGLTEIDTLAELRDSRLRLEDYFGKTVRGFRAPFFRPPETNEWWRLLRQTGYAYDSSFGSLSMSRQNIHPALWKAEAHDGIVELPMTTIRGGWAPFNIATMRMLYPISAWLMHPEARIFSTRLSKLNDPRAWAALELVLRNYGAGAITCWDMAGQATGSR